VDSGTRLTLSFIVDEPDVEGPLTASLTVQRGGYVYLNAVPSFGQGNGSVLVKIPVLEPSWYTLRIDYTKGGVAYYQQFDFRAGEAGGSQTGSGGGGGCSTAGWGFAVLALLALSRKTRKKY
jgi:hypothetical protein